MSNYIVPLSSLPSITSIAEPKTGNGQAGQLQGLPFSDVLQNAIENMTAAGEQSQASMYNLAIGGSDDLHTGAVDALKYNTAISYTSAVAGSVVRAYNELMRMSI